MSYKEKPQIKLYKYQDGAFILQAIIDDYQECSFEHNRFSAGQFSITINYNIPNASLFERGLFVQFSNDPYAFGEILNITDSIGEDGKGSQVRDITGYDSRYIFKRRVIKNLNNNGSWAMTDKGEICIRNLVKDQCGSGAESKRQLPVNNTIPASADAIGKIYSVSEAFSNLYEVLTTIATQSEIGWRLYFDGSGLTLECYQGTDRSQTVRFDTDYESLSNGTFTDSSESFANAIYIGGKGTGSERDIYEGEVSTEGEQIDFNYLRLDADSDDRLRIEDGFLLINNEQIGVSPSGLDRFECWDNQSQMTIDAEYEAEAISMLSQYGQTLEVSGQGLAKCPYEYGKEYNVGDVITIAFSGKSAVVQILAVTEHWSWGSYDLQFSFGKPLNDLNKQLQLILNQIQRASDKTSATDSVKWYTIPADTQQDAKDVTFNTIGFVGNCAEGGSTFTLYLDNEKTGAKTYHIYFKQLGGGTLTLTTGRGATDLIMNSGTYVAIVYVDANGNVTSQGATPTDTIEAGNTQPVSSQAVAESKSYSTTETLTGGKWIDGKPIYRKVIEFNSETEIPTGGKSYTLSALGLSDIDNIFSVYAFNTTGSKTTKRRFSPLSMYWESDTTIQVRATSSVTSYFLGLIIEYTKTTE